MGVFSYFWLIALTLTAPVAFAADGWTLIDGVAASVNKSLILQSDVTRFKKAFSLRAQLDPLFSSTRLATLGVKAPDSEVIEYLIDERMICDLFPTSDQEAEQEIAQIQAGNRIDRKTLRNAIESQGFSFSDYFEIIRVSSSKKTLIEREIRSKVSISDEEIKQHYYNTLIKEKPSDFTFKLRLITFNVKNYKSAGEALKLAQDAKEQIKRGDAFEDIAKKMSDDTSSGSGGDLGYLSESELLPELKDALKKLKIGEVSDIMGNAQKQYFLLKLEDVKTDSDSRFQNMKEEIRGQLYSAEYQRQISLWIERQRQVMHIYKSQN